MLCFLSMASRIIQKLSYELFLLTHVLSAVICVYSLWEHLPAKHLLPRLYLYIFTVIFGAMLALEGAIVLIRNGVFHHQCSRATMTCSVGMVHLRLHLARPFHIKPGQHINLWMPSVSLGACLQVHPFVVTSWTAGPQSTLELFVQPRRGFTRDLLRLASRGSPGDDRWVMFSGPHGQAVPVDEYDNVLLVADGVGIVAQLPYLKRLIHGYHTGQVMTRKIHLVWQISDIGKSFRGAASTSTNDQNRHWYCCPIDSK